MSNKVNFYLYSIKNGIQFYIGTTVETKLNGFLKKKKKKSAQE